ncbi:hypothetical protein QVD17_28355 [Tagetes erecta]|uniref:Uncharacterized protein n=1 Tax=Tagetes erecta TaxID=13708 RepID=A0AAD8NSE0_TARER|nr:hypothetical protein QVD17_28355 [Tagetes erecta]
MVHGGLYPCGRCQNENSVSIDQTRIDTGMNVSPSVHGSSCASGGPSTDYPPIEVLSRCELLFPYISSKETLLENTMTPCPTQYHTTSPTTTDNSVYILEMTPPDEYKQDQSQHFQVDMDFAKTYVDLLEQHEQVSVPQAHVSMPKLKPKEKLSLKEKQENNISCALEKIAKEQSEDIPTLAGQLRSFYGNEDSVQVFSPFAMYPEVVPEYIEFEAVLQCLSNGLLNICFIHCFEM